MHIVTVPEDVWKHFQRLGATHIGYHRFPKRNFITGQESSDYDDCGLRHFFDAHRNELGYCHPGLMDFPQHCNRYNEIKREWPPHMWNNVKMVELPKSC